jgi:DNA-binding response OmpR family regulator
MDEIWGYDSDSDPRTVDTHVKRLREKLLSFTGFEIQTVRGLGYRAVLKNGNFS